MIQTCSHFQLTRTIAAPPDRLWTLLTDPKAREVWGGPSEDTVMVLETADLREGGQERHRCGPADAPEFVVDTHWYHLEAPNRACFTETVIAGGAKMAVTLVTYGLTPHQGATTLTVDVSLSPLAEGDMLGDFSEGWEQGLNSLERWLADGAFDSF